MFEKVIELFKRKQCLLDKRFNDFSEFYLYCINNFPKDLKNKLARLNINPIEIEINDHIRELYDGYSMGFTYDDYVWWNESYNLESFPVYPVEIMSKRIMSYVLDIIDAMPDVDDNNKLYNEGLEILEKND